MELKRSKTAEALQSAFAAESQAYTRYMLFAAAARKAELEQIADIFSQVAKNEAEHAEHEFNFLGGFVDTKKNLEAAARREHYEWTEMYPELQKTAREEGFTEIADFFQRMSKVEEKHEKLFLQLLESLKKDQDIEGGTVGHSAIDMAQLMLPHQANPAGYVHGGELMKMMDNAAGVVASRHAHTNVVTANVEEINFHHPVRVGDLVIIHAQLSFVSHSSMEVRLKVETEDLTTGFRLQALTAYYNMVALDTNGRPTHVPPLIISTEEEESLFNKRLARHQDKKRRKANES
jgi:Acyl-CoA hydrolase